jgi:hypothetical protein
MPDGIQSAASMSDWMRVLDQIQESIERAIRESDEQDRCLDHDDAATGASTWPEAERRCLDQIDERLRGLEGHLGMALRLTQEVEGLLAADEAEVRAWAARATAARERLAGTDTAGIS